jgi:hypothetical protein
MFKVGWIFGNPSAFEYRGYLYVDIDDLMTSPGTDNTFLMSGKLQFEFKEGNMCQSLCLSLALTKHITAVWNSTSGEM